MDRNGVDIIVHIRCSVALRKESVDRNTQLALHAFCRARVALRKESVDRNCISGGAALALGQVALRKESVDRNGITTSKHTCPGRSLSARRAWIEIGSPPLHSMIALVALRKESVDRNI